MYTRASWNIFSSESTMLGARCRCVTLATDASLSGWGAVMSDHPAYGLWSGRHLTWHINCLEMLAVFRALKHFLLDLRDHHVLVRADILSRQGWGPGNGCFNLRGEADMESLGQAQVDPFATRHTMHCPLWLYLTHPAPLDSMVQTWPRLHLYAFPRSLCSQEF